MLDLSNIMGCYKVENSVFEKTTKSIIDNEVKKYPILTHLLAINGVVLCGGFLRDALLGVEPSDIDIFFTSEEAVIKAHEILEIEKGIYVSNYDAENITIQLVHKEVFLSPEDVISNFDFSPIQLAYTQGSFYVGKKTLKDIVEKNVTVNIITKPLCSLNRLSSYASKGWEFKEAYKYILEVMLDRDPNVCLLGGFYEGDIDE